MLNSQKNKTKKRTERKFLNVLKNCKPEREREREREREGFPKTLILKTDINIIILSFGSVFQGSFTQLLHHRFIAFTLDTFLSDVLSKCHVIVLYVYCRCKLN